MTNTTDTDTAREAHEAAQALFHAAWHAYGLARIAYADAARAGDAEQIAAALAHKQQAFVAYEAAHRAAQAAVAAYATARGGRA